MLAAVHDIRYAARTLQRRQLFTALAVAPLALGMVPRRPGTYWLDARSRCTAMALDELARSAQERFPLSDAAAADLRADLQRRLLALHDVEVAAHGELSLLLDRR
jgi:hypothetical protein